MVTVHQLHRYLGDRSRLPDHSILIAEFECNFYSNVFTNETNEQCTDETRFKLRSIPSDFMNSELSRTAINNIITQIEQCRETQCDIDSIYDKLCDSIINEMTTKIPTL